MINDYKTKVKIKSIKITLIKKTTKFDSNKNNSYVAKIRNIAIHFKSKYKMRKNLPIPLFIFVIALFSCKKNLPIDLVKEAEQESIPEKKPIVVHEAYFKKLQTETVISNPNIQWINFGPAMSGYCDEMWIHPTDPNYMYTTLDMGNCYYTDNNAYSWTSIHDYDMTGDYGRIGWIDFSHQDENFGLALDEKGYLMKTTNKGKRFEYIYKSSRNGFPVVSGQGKKSVIVVDPTNDNNWYIGAGQFWRVKDIHRSLNNYHGTTYRNTAYGYFLISKDKGVTWKQVKVGHEDLDVARIFVNPVTPSEVYAFTNYGFYKSTNGGDSWNVTGSGLPYNLPRDGAMCYDKKNNKVILYLLEQTNYHESNSSVTSTGGVFKSIDNGETWSNITGDMAIDYTVFSNTYSLREQFHRAIAYWFDISKTESKNKFTKYPSSILSIYNRIVVNPNNPDEIYVSNNVKHDYSFGPVEMWKTSDGGKHWAPCVRSGSYWSTKKDEKYWKSRNAKDDLGMNMKYAHLQNTMENYDEWVGVRFLIANSRGELYCVHEQQVLKSNDNGESWVQIDDIESTENNWVGMGNSNLPGVNIKLETGMNRYLFLSGEHGLWISGEIGDCEYNGVAVRQLSGQSKEKYDATSISTVAVNPKDTMNIFMLMFRQSYRGYLRASKDCGETWYNVNEKTPAVDYDKASQEHCEQNDLLIDKNNISRMYFTVPKLRYANYTSTQWERNVPVSLPLSKTGVYRSDNGGYTWSMANNGIPEDLSVWHLTMDPSDSETIYASVNGKFDNSSNPKKIISGGLYKTINGANSWEKVTIPEEIECVNNLFIDKNTGDLYLSAGQYNGDINNGGAWISEDNGKTWKKFFLMPYVKEIHTSNRDPNIITVNVGSGKKIGNLNPGAYISFDGGSTWSKSNFNLGQPARITSFKPDVKKKNIFWISLYGSGWYKGIWNENK